MPAPTNPPPQPSIYPSSPPPSTAGTWYPGSGDVDLAKLMQIMQRRRVLIGGVALTVTAAIWGWTLTRTAIYRGTFRVLVESVETADRPQPNLPDEASAAQPTADYATHMEVLQSPALLRPVAQALQDTYPDLSGEHLAANLAIARLDDTRVLEFSYQDTDPQKIQAVLEAVAQEVLDYSFEQRQASLQQGIRFVEEQLPDLQEEVDRLQERLERFRQQYGLLDPDMRGEELAVLISSVEEQRQTVQTQLSQARSLLQALQSQLATTPEEALAATALSESSRYQALLDQIQELEAQIALESARYQPTTPQIAALRERHDNLLPLLEAEAAKILGDRLPLRNRAPVDGNLTPTTIDLSRQLLEATNQVQMLQARSQTLAEVEQDLRQEFALVPSLSREYGELQRQLTLATESLNRFLATRESLQIDAAQQSVPWQLIADPTTSSRPLSPNVPRNLSLGAIAGLLLGLTVAVVAEKLDQVFHSPEDLKTVSPLPLLGTIPYLPNLPEQTSLLQRSQQFDRNGSIPTGSTAAHQPPTSLPAALFLEAFRSVYTNVRFLESDTPLRSLVISSAIPEEGKSVTALYLAKAAANMGQRVLLVDADLRSPKHHSRLHLQNVRGLSAVVTQGLRLEDAIQRSALDENLWVLTAGPPPPDPVQLLSSPQMQTLMEQLQSQYDLVIYDSPSVIGLADSSLLATHADGLIMVVGLGKTERIAFARALDELKLTPVSLLGMVANGVRAYTSRIYGDHRYYRGYAQSPREASNPVGAIVPAEQTAAEPRETASRTNNAASQRVGGAVGSVAAPSRSQPNSHRAASSEFAPFAKPVPSLVEEVEPAAPGVATLGQPLPQALKLAIAIPSLALLAGGGWLLYTRFVLAPRPTDDPGAPPADAQTNRPTAPGPPSGAPQARGQLPSNSPDVVPPESLPPESLPPERSPTAPTLEPPPQPGARPQNPSDAAADPFAVAERLAETTLQAEATAQTAQEWATIASQWQQAAALMTQVSGQDGRFETARDRAVRYRRNGELARQRVLELLPSPPAPQPDS